jgi:peptidase E
MDIKLPNKNVYILIGGGCHAGRHKDRLVTEIESWLSYKQIKIAKIVFIPFAKNKIDWNMTVQKYLNSFLHKLHKNNRLSISIAIPNKKTLKNQLSNADIIFFSGGSELNLKALFKKETLPIAEKIFIGISAGVNFLSKFYFSNDRGRIETGLGVLPISTICHFSTEKNNKAKLLSEGRKYPVIPIEDNKFVTIIF